MEAGQRIGRYQLCEKIGKGGMADIFKAEEQLPDGSTRTVAIKRLFPKLSADREFVSMFVNESRLASKMQHPNIIRTHNLINYGSYYYIVMEFLEGTDLEDLLHQRGTAIVVLSPPEAAFVASEVALGLAYAHRGGDRNQAGGPVVHRDISPGNILVGLSGQVKITDFGIARALEAVSHTQPGILKGKYEYMAPEYVQGKEFDGRADLFSLGVVLYEVLTGVSPFAAVIPKDVWDQLLCVEPAPPSQVVSGVPEELDKVVQRALAKDPVERFSSGDEMAAALAPFFGRWGKTGMANLLAARVGALINRPVPQTTQHDLQAFLPPEEERGDRTQEIQVDELLDLVEPLSEPEAEDEPEDMPRPAVELAEEARTISIDTGVVRRRRRRRLPRWALIAGPALVLLLVFLLVLLLWPESNGFLSVIGESGVEVVVDGKVVGKVPLQHLKLPVGAHDLEGRRPGQNQSKRLPVKIEAGTENTVELSFKGAPKNRPPQKPQNKPHGSHKKPR